MQLHSQVGAQPPLWAWCCGSGCMRGPCTLCSGHLLAPSTGAGGKAACRAGTSHSVWPRAGCQQSGTHGGRRAHRLSPRHPPGRWGIDGLLQACLWQLAHASVPHSRAALLQVWLDGTDAVSCQGRHEKCWSFSGAERRRAEKSPESCGGSPHRSQHLPSFQATWDETLEANCGELLGGLREELEAPSPQSTVLFTRNQLD